MKYGMYIGGYGKQSISRVTLRDGRLRLIESFPAVNASYLCISQDGTRLYAVNETQSFRGSVGGSVQSYLFENGRPILTSTQPTLGSDPCHLSIVGNLLIVSNYTSGSLSRFRLGDDGTICEALPLIEHIGRGPRGDRQSGAHVHQAQMTPNGWLAVADLGLDAIFFYLANQLACDQPECVRVSTPAGFGPRHCIFLRGSETWYVLCELESQLLVYRGALEKAMLVGRVEIGESSKENYPAAIRLSPNGKLLAVTGRGQNMIALFAIGINGLPTKLTEVSSMGDWPRDVQFTPDGQYLVCANERSNSLTAFAVRNGKLEFCDSLHLLAPSCVLFTDEKQED